MSSEDRARRERRPRARARALAASCVVAALLSLAAAPPASPASGAAARVTAPAPAVVAAPRVTASLEASGSRLAWFVTRSTPYPFLLRRPAVAFDSDRGALVLFGGASEFFDEKTPDEATYSFTAELRGLWTTKADTRVTLGPRARFAHAMVYDDRRKRTLLYGGDTRYGGNVGDPPGSLEIRLVGDAWEWDGTSWRELCATCPPGALAGHVMAYDAERGRTVLFGGATSRFPHVVSGATWESDGSTWTPRCGASGLPACAPAPRADGAMVWDAARKRTVLFGGRTADGKPLADTWEWDGDTWTPRCGAAGQPECGPPARFDHAMAYNPARARASISGGTVGPSGGQFIHGDIWEWDGAQWSPICGAEPNDLCPMPGRAGHAMGYYVEPDPPRRRLLVVGGHNLPPSNLVYYATVEGYSLPGACETTADCDVGHCVDGTCCETAFCPICASCNILGAAGRCAPVVDADHPSCVGTCDERGACRGKRGATACTRAEECASNACADGVCCDRPCGGSPCEACSVAAGGVEDGVCGPMRARSPGRPACGDYACDGRSITCPDRCTSDLECAPGRSCGIDGTCARPKPCDGRFLTLEDGTTTDCAPYACEGNGCKTTCASVNDCTAGSVCRVDHTCGPIPPSDVARGCAIARASRPGAGLAALGALALALGVRRGSRGRRA